MEKGTLGGAVERAYQERESGEEKTERVKEGKDGRRMMHGRQERMREGRG